MQTWTITSVKLAVLKSPNKWKKRNAWNLSYKINIKKKYNINSIQKLGLKVNLNKRITKKKLYIKTMKAVNPESSRPYSDLSNLVFLFVKDSKRSN